MDSADAKAAQFESTKQTIAPSDVIEVYAEMADIVEEVYNMLTRRPKVRRKEIAEEIVGLLPFEAVLAQTIRNAREKT